MAERIAELRAAGLSAHRIHACLPHREQARFAVAYVGAVGRPMEVLPTDEVACCDHCRRPVAIAALLPPAPGAWRPGGEAEDGRCPCCGGPVYYEAG